MNIVLVLDVAGLPCYVRVRQAVEADQLATIRYGTATMTPWSRADQMARV